MKIHIDPEIKNKNRISAYSPGNIVIDDTRIENNCVILPNQIIHDWQVASIECIRCQDFDPVIDLNPEIILLGTGMNAVLPPMEICAYVQSKQIGFEFMDSGAAIRSYNILLGEDRNVALVLFLS